MSNPIHDRSAMIAGMDAHLDARTFAFVTAEAPHPDAIGTFREDEGWSSIVPEAGGSMRLITLRIHSSLEGVGLTAAVAGRLADHGIACNMVAAYHHDHLFIPAADAERAVDLLHILQAEYEAQS